ncbi:hypothetical protein E1301_Tti014490 [Triplophysa tibetana]|uniref:Uncharacterized protein n=1 Tax=Triplophysa tibetana TaxID=1572043 RepID=A0A5A9PIQ8_9TELE|nr:hypothetical protein E1301_Tti014490 [Triplophysa tibetana]
MLHRIFDKKLQDKKIMWIHTSDNGHAANKMLKGTPCHHSVIKMQCESCGQRAQFTQTVILLRGQEAKWMRERGCGRGKDHEPGFKLGSPGTHQRRSTNRSTIGSEAAGRLKPPQQCKPASMGSATNSQDTMDYPVERSLQIIPPAAFQITAPANALPAADTSSHPARPQLVGWTAGAEPDIIWELVACIRLKLPFTSSSRATRLLNPKSHTAILYGSSRHTYNLCETTGYFPNLCVIAVDRLQDRRLQPFLESLHLLHLVRRPLEGEVAVPGEDNDSSHLPPPPPEEEDESLISLTIATKMRQLEIRMEKMEKESVDSVQGVDVSVQNYLQQYDHRLIAIEGLMPDLIKLVTSQSSFNQSLKKCVFDRFTHADVLKSMRITFVARRTARWHVDGKLQDLASAVTQCSSKTCFTRKIDYD